VAAIKLLKSDQIIVTKESIRQKKWLMFPEQSLKE